MEGYLQYCGGITAVRVGNSFSTVGDTFNTVEVFQYSEGITSVQWGNSFTTSLHWGITSTHVGEDISTVGDKISTVEGIQYSGGRILITSCFSINNDEKISIFFALRYEIFIRKFRKF